MKEEQAKNAIKWIDELPKYKQAKKEMRGYLGDETEGYCCLGAACAINAIDYSPNDHYSDKLVKMVGLLDVDGQFNRTNAGLFYGHNQLASINDCTNAGFKRISNLMKKNPHWMFKPEVAE